MKINNIIFAYLIGAQLTWKAGWVSWKTWLWRNERWLPLGESEKDFLKEVAFEMGLKEYVEIFVENQWNGTALGLEFGPGVVNLGSLIPAVAIEALETSRSPDGVLRRLTCPKKWEKCWKMREKQVCALGSHS